jgi:heme-degrading monooxygenase HmoA
VPELQCPLNPSTAFERAIHVKHPSRHHHDRIHLPHDKFIVPQDAVPAFMSQVQRVQQALDAQAGCRQNLVLSQPAEDGGAKVVTIVEWSSPEAMAAARSSMQARYAREGFDPAAFMKKLGVSADLGVYATAPRVD